VHDGGRARVALVIPALDEATAIGPVVRAVPAGLVDQVVVVDNGSTDGTGAAARAAGAKVVVEPRRGYGAACWAGVQALEPAIDVVVFLDGDGSQDPAELPRLLAPLWRDEADLVLGIRRFETGGHPRHAVLGTLAVALVLRYRFGLALRDLGPFRAVRRSALERLALQDRGYGWPVEMIVKAARAGLRIGQVEVSHRPRQGGRSKVAGTLVGSVRAGWRFLAVALREGRAGGAGTPE
jgi:glycosyltransferase involved in cell wall biosynthesis